jgi:hypothetical protein
MSKAQTIDEYIQRFPGWRGQAVSRVRTVVLEAEPKLRESIKWAQPVFELSGPVCYMKVFANHVNFGFWRGASLKDPDQLLLGDGEKMRNVRLSKLADIDAPQFARWVREAAKLNLALGNPSSARRARE